MSLEEHKIGIFEVDNLGLIGPTIHTVLLRIFILRGSIFYRRRRFRKTLEPSEK
jgi:hypothetical protein